MKTNSSKVWPYIVVGSAVGGAVAYLLTTESCRKIRRSITHPDQLANNLEEARGFIEEKAKTVTGKMRTVLDRAKEGMQEGQRAFHEAERDYRSNLQRLEGKNNEIASNVHKTVDNVSRTAVTVEQSILDPLYEARAVYRGIERGVRSLFRRNRNTDRIPTPIPSDQRVTG